MSTELRLTTQWQNALSPVTISFEQFEANAIGIEFTQPWNAYRSPVSIEFGAAPVPQIPIGPPNVSAYTSSLWTNRRSCRNDINNGYVAGLESQRLCLKYKTEFGLSQFASTSWLSAASIKSSIDVPVMSLPLEAEWIELKGSIQQLITRVATTGWQQLQQPYQDIAITWSSTLVEQKDIVFWCAPTLSTDQFNLGYLDCQANVSRTIIKWGPHPGRWVCSSAYISPEPGIITMGFSEPLAPSLQPLLIELRESARVCIYDDGGGLVDAHPPVPPFDFTVPIGPQIRRAYIMQPTLTCRRRSDNLEVNIIGVSISDSRDQMTQDVSIDLGSRIDAERIINEQIEIDIYGWVFLVTAEDLSANISFASGSWSVEGRTLSAGLGTPYQLPTYYTNPTRTFGGLLSDLLQNSGWSISLDNSINDFPVPAGAFNVAGQTPLDAVKLACSQLGLMVTCDDENTTMKVVPRWPVSPWAMEDATVDIAIHDSVIINYAFADRIEPECNVVWCRGEQHGIDAKVRRHGTAGDKAADDILAPLVVDTTAARLAGTNALAETGHHQIVTMTLPVMTDLPPLTPGQLIGVTFQGDTYKAVCDKRTVNASMANETLKITQQVSLIRHME